VPSVSSTELAFAFQKEGLAPFDRYPCIQRYVIM
jgi:hypothetical protein